MRPECSGGNPSSAGASNVSINASSVASMPSPVGQLVGEGSVDPELTAGGDDGGQRISTEERPSAPPLAVLDRLEAESPDSSPTQRAKIATGVTWSASNERHTGTMRWSAARAAELVEGWLDGHGLASRSTYRYNPVEPSSSRSAATAWMSRSRKMM